MSRTQFEYDDEDYVQLSQLCEICGDRWFDDRPLKQWSRHPKVTVHVECDELDDIICKSADAPPKKQEKNYSLTSRKKKNETIVITIKHGQN